MKESESSPEDEIIPSDLSDEECDEIIFNATAEAYRRMGKSGESKTIN